MILTKSEHEALIIMKRNKNSSMLGNRNWEAVNMIHNSCGRSLERKGVVTLRLAGDGSVFAFLNEGIEKCEFKVGDVVQLLGTNSKATILSIDGEEYTIDCGRHGQHKVTRMSLIDPLATNDWIFRHGQEIKIRPKFQAFFEEILKNPQNPVDK